MSIDPLIVTRKLTAGYTAAAAVRDVSMHVEPGEVVALLGPNGAGKTSTLLAIAGVLQVHSGEIKLFGSRTPGAPHKRARAGLGFATDDKPIARGLTVAQNLDLARCNTESAVELFPELGKLLGRTTGLLSGGEQQMLSIARTVTRFCRLVLVDELSLGLAPAVIARLHSTIRSLADSGLGVLVVEQHVERILAVADRAYVMQGGAVRLEGTGKDLLSRRSDIENVYVHGSVTVGEPLVETRADAAGQSPRPVSPVAPLPSLNHR